MLRSKNKECKPPRNDIKVVSVIEMTFLYDARYSVVLLRQKNEVKLLTQSAAKWICMYGEMASIWRDGFISQSSERPKTFLFFQGLRLLPMRSLKKLELTRGRAQRNKN